MALFPLARLPSSLYIEGAVRRESIGVLDWLINVVTRVGHWGYLLLFLAATLESAAFLGLIVPGESLVLVGGFFAARGLLDIGDLIVVVGAGAVLGDSVGYEMVRHLGRSWLLRYGRWVGLRAVHLEHADAFFARHGGKTVFFGRFVGFLRALAPFVAGASGMRYAGFLLYNALGGLIWATSFVLLGYFLGASWQKAERWIGRASAIVGGALLLILALVWLWRWLVRHEASLKQTWTAFLEHPRVTALRRRFAPQLAFLQARLSPEGYVGLHVTLGALVLIGAAWLFGGIAEDVITGDPLTVVDADVATWLHARATPSVVRAMQLITLLGSASVVTGVAAATAFFLVRKRRRFSLLALVLAMAGGMALNVLLKDIFHRGRPSFDNPIVVLTSYSFPSGHTMAATLLYGMLAALVAWTAESWRWRATAVLVAGLLILLVGFSRMALGLHYLSDVLAAMAAGLAWLSICLTGVETLWRWRDSRGM